MIFSCFPPYEEELLNQSGFEVPDLNFDETKPVAQASSQNYFFVSAFLAFIIVCYWQAIS